MTTPASPDVSEPTFRRAGAADLERLVDVMERVRAHYAGAKHRAVYRAIATDSVGPNPKVITAVAECDGEIVGFVSAIASDARRYWATLPVRHPAAALEIVRHRLRKFRTRIDYRRRNRSTYQSDEVLVPRVEVPPEVADRLSARPPTHGSPRPGEHGREVSLGLFMGIDPVMRGRRLGVRLFERLFAELRAAGVQRYDCSFSLQDPAAIRMHCNYPFTIYRLPGGYWASLRLADLG